MTNLHPIMQQALSPFIASADLTISEELAARGYGHRPGKMEGRREIFHAATGEIVGDFWAHKAIEAVEAHAALQEASA